MYRIYNICMHLSDIDYIRAVKYMETNKLYYIYRRLTSNKQKPNSITVYGHLDQLEDFKTFIFGGDNNEKN